MTDKHTPGPWIVSTGAVYVDNGKEWPTTPIAHMDRDTPFTRPVERDANARLIAAAPELLEALEYTRDILHGTACQEEDDCVEACESARAAIKAARKS